MKKSAKQSAREQRSAKQAKLVVYTTAEAHDELIRIGEEQCPGMTVQKFIEQIFLTHIRRFQKAERDGTLVVDEFGRKTLPPIDDE